MSFCTEDVFVRSCRIHHGFCNRFCDFVSLHFAQNGNSMVLQEILRLRIASRRMTIRWFFNRFCDSVSLHAEWQFDRFPVDSATLLRFAQNDMVSKESSLKNLNFFGSWWIRQNLRSFNSLSAIDRVILHGGRFRPELQNPSRVLQ